MHGDVYTFHRRHIEILKINCHGGALIAYATVVLEVPGSIPESDQ